MADAIEVKHHGSDKRPMSPSSLNPASPTFSRPSWTDHYRQSADLDALQKAIAATDLARTIASLAQADMLIAGPLPVPEGVMALRRVLGDAWAEEHALVRSHPSWGNRREFATLPRWLLALLSEHDTPANVLAAALPAEPHRMAALRAVILNWLAHSLRDRRGGVPRLDGVALLRHFDHLPASGRAAFPEVTHTSITALAAISPDGEVCLRLAGKSFNIEFATALLIDGQLSAWLATQAKPHKKNGASK